ncbi:MAG TPA: MBL fold metallo-hydrolase [Bryobacteraceae bacterium]|nr:MBL fold metallo-hydrolase [Bryobacteraceae bacterium]
MRFPAGFLPLPLILGMFAIHARAAEEIPTQAGMVKITPIQHASVLIEAAGQTIYIDPAMGNYDSLPPADLILITDIHGDHMAPPLVQKLRKPGAVVFAPEAVAKTITSATVIRNGESKAFGKWKIEAVPMYNLTRGPQPGKFFHDKGRGNGYVLTFGGKRFYFSGDTEGTPEMRALQHIDVAFVCMNVPYTMTPQEAADAVRAFHPKIVYPYHYRNSDTQAFATALEGSGIEVRLRNWYSQ